MMTEVSRDHVQQAGMRWTRRLAESFLDQLSSHQLFMDVDIIPEVWVSRKIARRQHWEGEPVTELSSR